MRFRHPALGFEKFKRAAIVMAAAAVFTGANALAPERLAGHLGVADAQPGCGGFDPSSGAAAGWAGGSNNLLTHWYKHRSERPEWHGSGNGNQSDREALERYARDARDQATTGNEMRSEYTLTQGANRGRRISYQPFGSDGPAVNSRGLFVVSNSDGKVISAFAPKKGKDYYDAQVKKDKGGHELRGGADHENDADIYTIYTKVECS
ncbi:MAG: hypothetical protein ACRC20_12460 [Segniliparus sp.]|uniref:hypothetical protein n=1 Tax=Segniliparus sp. TaxID=2804064 RepID=UPI003F39BF21